MSEVIWKKNLGALDDRYNLLKEALLNYKAKLDLELDENIDSTQSKYGVTEVADKKILYAIEGDSTIQLDTLYDTDKMITIWMENQSTIGYMTKCIFCGLGNGMYVKKILRVADDTMQVLVYEPSLELFIKVMEEFELEDILKSKRFTLIVENNYPITIKEYLYKFVDYRDLEKLIYQSYPNYDKIMNSQLREMDNEIQQMYNTIRATQDVMARYGISYFANSLINIPWFINSKSITSLFYKCPKSIPVFIVASGPSLDKNIEELKNAKGKSLIIAADSAIKALLKHNIIPDMYVTIDAGKQYAHFEDKRIADIPAICELSSNGNVVRKHKKEIFFINDLNTYVNGYLTQKDILLPVFSSGGSVTNTAFAIVTSMGFENVVLVGQDLAYTDNKTHSVNTVRGTMNIDPTTLEGIMIEGYDNKLVRSSYEFQLYLNWFEEQIIKNPNTRTINATEGGAMIHGAENRKLYDVIKEICVEEINITNIIASTDDLFADAQKKEVKEKMYGLVDELDKLRLVINRGIRDYGKMEELAYQNNWNSSQIVKLLKSTQDITKQIESASAMYYIQNLMQQTTQQFLQEVYHSEDEPKKEIICAASQGKKYLEIIKETIGEAIPKIKRTLDKLFNEYETLMYKM